MRNDDILPREWCLLCFALLCFALHLFDCLRFIIFHIKECGWFHQPVNDFVTTLPVETIVKASEDRAGDSAAWQ